jgi:HSP20 family protein
MELSMSIRTFPISAALPTITIRRELDRLFDEATTSRQPAGWQPSAEAREDATGYSLTLDLPGVSPESVEVLAEDSVLTVKAERTAAPLAEGERVLFAERSHGAFTRRFRLPKSADLQSVSASYAHGVLSVRVAKVAPVQPRKVTINVAN